PKSACCAVCPAGSVTARAVLARRPIGRAALGISGAGVRARGGGLDSHGRETRRIGLQFRLTPGRVEHARTRVGAGAARLAAARGDERGGGPYAVIPSRRFRLPPITRRRSSTESFRWAFA